MESNFAILIHMFLLLISGVTCFVSYLCWLIEDKYHISCPICLISMILCIGSFIFYGVGNTKCQEQNWVIDENHTQPSISYLWVIVT